MNFLSNLTDAVPWGSLAILMGAAAAVGLLLRAHLRLHRRASPESSQLLATAKTATPTPARDPAEAGTATVEFALVFPIVLFLTLVMLQVMLLMTGSFAVQYAAFAAARTAIVQVPVDDTQGYYGVYGNEPANVLNPASDGRKMRTIHQAAAFAMMPVSGPLKQGNVATQAFVEGLAKHYQEMGRPVPPWINGLAADRLRYADAYTQVRVLLPRVEGDEVTYEPVPGGGHIFGPKDPITVQVQHQFFLSIPYVRLIFADGTNEVAGGEGRYALITAQATLSNEGWNPALPPKPTLPRKP